MPPDGQALKGAVYAQHDVLHHLGVDLAILGHRFLDARQFSLLLGIGDRDTAQPPRFSPFTDCGVADMAAEHQGVFKRLLKQCSSDCSC
jgi:hypothetical protein